MNQTKAIHQALKRLLRARGFTYADAGPVLGLSEASIKRLFSRHALSLNRLETLCNWLQVDVFELVGMSREQEPLTTQLSEAQEVELLKDSGLLLLAYLLLNRWTPGEILETYAFSRNDLTRRMFRLQKLGLVEVQPFDRVRLKTARNFSWRKDGPVQRFFAERVLGEFLASRFEATNEAMEFVGGMLTPRSIEKIQARVHELAREFDGLVEEDLRLPVSERQGVSLFSALRPWEFSEFSRYRRQPLKR